MGRKRKAANGGKVANKGKTPTSETTNDEEKGLSETARTVLESKDVEDNVHSPSNGPSPEHICHIEHILENEKLVEKGKEQANCRQQVGNETILDERNIEQKVCRTTDDDPSAELCYKSMYISSQKQVESLMAENCRLSMNLEFARGKIEAYERMNDATRATKDVILVNPTRAKIMENAIGNGNSAPDADHHEKSPENNASIVANQPKRVSQRRRKNC